MTGPPHEMARPAGYPPEPMAPTPMPVFRPDQARLALGDARFERALADPDSLDLLVWNVFSTLETHEDQEWLAYRLQMFGGTKLTVPVRLQLWSGRDTEPLLVPSREYRKLMQERARARGAAVEIAPPEPIEMAVRIESPQVLCLVDVTGTDRLVELVDAGLTHARRLGKDLAVSIVYRAGTPEAAALSRRIARLRDPAELDLALPHRPRTVDLSLREVPWQQLLQVWEAEADHLDLPTSPRPFLRHLAARGWR